MVTHERQIAPKIEHLPESANKHLREPLSQVQEQPLPSQVMLQVVHCPQGRERRARQMLVEPKSVGAATELHLLSNYQLPQDQYVDTVGNISNFNQPLGADGISIYPPNFLVTDSSVVRDTDI